MRAKKCVRMMLVLAGFALVLTATIAMAGGRGVTDTEVKLGNVMCKTGPVAALGIPQGNAMVDYMNYINETQGGVNGRKIKVIWEDDGFQAPKSVAAVKKLISRDKVLTIMSAGGTNQTIANMRNIERYKISNIPNGLSLEFFEPLNPYIFAMGAVYDWQYKVIMDYIKYDLKMEDPKIGVVYTRKEYGKKGLNAVKNRAAKYNIPVVAELVLPTGAVDATSQVLALQKANANIVVTCDVLPPIISFLKTAEKHNYWPKVFGFNWATDDLLVKACGKAAQNYIGTGFVGAWHDDTPGMKLVRQIAAKYEREPKLSSLYVGGIGVSMMFAEAIKRAGKDLNPDTLQAAFETFSNFETGGILPPITWNAKSHAPSDKVKLYKADVEGKRLVPITGWRSPRK